MSDGGIFSGGGLPFVNSAMKIALAENGVPFGITGAVAKTRNNFGDDETSFAIVISAKAAKAAKSDEIEAGEYKLAFSHTEVREEQANKLLNYLVSNKQYGPVYLAQVETKSGQTAWAIAEEPSDEPVKATTADNDSAGADSDDGIPY